MLTGTLNTAGLPQMDAREKNADSYRDNASNMKWEREKKNLKVFDIRLLFQIVIIITCFSLTKLVGKRLILQVRLTHENYQAGKMVTEQYKIWQKINWWKKKEWINTLARIHLTDTYSNLQTFSTANFLTSSAILKVQYLSWAFAFWDCLLLKGYNTSWEFG